jgi:hypothetical protein
MISNILINLKSGKNYLPYEKLRVILQYYRDSDNTLIFTGIDFESFLTCVVQASQRYPEGKLSIVPGGYHVRDVQKTFCKERKISILEEIPPIIDIRIEVDGSMHGSLEGKVTETEILIKRV